MENKIKFRNHVSIILENSLKTIGTVVFLFVLNFISDSDEMGIQVSDVVFLTVFLLIAIGLITGLHAVIWSRTYITIEENTLVIERNTLNKKRNTIGLKTISNVNLEQNLLEMILGTCKVKLDTNSLSTAEETDVKIVLKKTEAERFRQMVLCKAEEKEFSTANEEAGSNQQPVQNMQMSDKLLIGDMGDIMLHGLFSIRISMIILLIVLGFFQITMLLDAENIGETIVEMFVNMITLFWFSGIIIWGILKEFIKYLNFRIERKKDKVYLNYGLFKKVAYSVPVDKINGIRLTQTPIARMAKRYMVEIINVGMDDDENETNTFFLPYSKLEIVKAQIHLLLPEFDGAIEIKEERQSKAIWLLSVPWLLLYIAVVAVIYIAIPAMESELKTAVVVVAVVMFCWRLITKTAGFFTKGIKVDKQFLKIVDGKFAKRTLFVKYDKIQYVTGKQCVIARHFKIQKGTIFLLASMKNRIHELPYFKEAEMEKLKDFLIS